MTPAPLYLSYGMPKSGSTLAFELTRTLLELAGIPQIKICPKITGPSNRINFAHVLDGTGVEALINEASCLARPIVIKTHCKVFPRIERLLQEGALTGHAVCRDPRDMALSMLDAGREGRAWGGGKGNGFQTVADTEQRLRKSIHAFEKWAQMPNVIPIHYERLAFDTEAVASEICQQLGIEVDISKAVSIATGTKFTQLNRGISQRWRTELHPEDAARLGEMFKDYIATYCSEIPLRPVAHKPKRGLFSRLFPRKKQDC